MKFDEAWDHVQLKNGGSLLGKVTNPTFEITLDGTDTTITLENRWIISIVFRNRSGLNVDRVLSVNGSQLYGTVKTDPIVFESIETGRITIPAREILALQLTYDLDKTAWA